MRHPRLTLGIVLAVVCTCVQAGPSPTPDTVVSAFYTWAMRPMSHVVPDRVADVFAADLREALRTQQIYEAACAAIAAPGYQTSHARPEPLLPAP